MSVPELQNLAGVAAADLQRVVDALYRVHRLVPAMINLDTLLERIIVEGKDVTDAEGASLMLYDPTRDDLYFHVALTENGNPQRLKEAVRLKLGQGVAGLAAQSRQAINIPDVDDDPRHYRGADQATRFKTKSLLALPLLEHDRLVGVLELVNKRGGEAFTETDRMVMEMFGGLAASAITNAWLIEENIRQERLAAMGRTVAGLSHYVKNIIAAIEGSTELVEEGLGQDNVEMLQRSWPMLRRNTKRLSLCMEDMLSFSKTRTPIYEDVEPDDFFDDVRTSFCGLFLRKQIDFEIDYSGVKGVLCLDSRGLYRCLLNLLGNAADAVPEQGGQIRLLARSCADDMVAIEVEDNGPGVPEELRQRVFEPFYSSKGSGGTGLGLAVTRKVVHEHGGDIEVGQSELGGARFLMRIPQGSEHSLNR